MTTFARLMLVLVLVGGFVAATGLTALAAPDDGIRHQNKAMMQKQINHQHRVTAQQDQELTAAGAVATLNADRDRDRLKDGTGDGDPDRDRDRLRLQDRLMDCLDDLLELIRGAGSR